MGQRKLGLHSHAIQALSGDKRHEKSIANPHPQEGANCVERNATVYPIGERDLRSTCGSVNEHAKSHREQPDREGETRSLNPGCKNKGGQDTAEGRPKETVRQGGMIDLEKIESKTDTGGGKECSQKKLFHASQRERSPVRTGGARIRRKQTGSPLIKPVAHCPVLP
jgi:hypothetical protein